MADVASAVRLFLVADSDVNNLIGSRIFTDQPPQAATLPYCLMNQLFATHDHTLSNLAGLAHARLQFDAISNTRQQANEIIEAIRTSGIITQKGISNGVDIRGCRIEEGVSYQYIAARDGSDQHLYVCSFDLIVDYVESI